MYYFRLLSGINLVTQDIKGYLACLDLPGTCNLKNLWYFYVTYLGQLSTLNQSGLFHSCLEQLQEKQNRKPYYYL